MQNLPLSKLNNWHFALRAMLPLPVNEWCYELHRLRLYRMVG